MGSGPIIFVSAVTQELKSTRELVVRTLRQLGCEPIHQEEFGSPTGVVRSVLDRHLEPCQAVIQLVGHRYGWDWYDAPDPSQSMSYTHYEARYAHEHQRPVWYFLISDDYPVDHPNDEDAEKKVLQAGYRIRVGHPRHLHYTVSNLQDVELLVYRMLRDLDALRPAAARWFRNIDEAAEASAPPAPTGVSKTEMEQMMRGLLTEFVLALQNTQRTRDTDAAARKEDDLYLRLGTALGVGPEEAREKLRGLAEHRTDDRTAPWLERANASFLLKDYAKAERHALTAAAKALQAKPPRTNEAVEDYQFAAKAAREHLRFGDASRHLTEAETLTDRRRDPLIWGNVQLDRAYLLFEEGKAHDAERILRRLTAVRQRLLGSEAPDTLTSRNALANALSYQDKHREAEPEYRAVLSLRRRDLGPNHPTTLTVRNNLALALHFQGKHAEAAREHRAVLAIRKSILGEDDPDTLQSRSNLALAVHALKKYRAAEKEFRAVLATQERVFNPTHPKTLRTCLNLAFCLKDQGKRAEALTLAQRARDGLKSVFDTNHPHYRQAANLCDELAAALKA